jgi:hypothetical protein
MDLALVLKKIKSGQVACILLYFHNLILDKAIAKRSVDIEAEVPLMHRRNNP